MRFITKGNRRQRYIGFIIKTSDKKPEKSILLNEIRRQCKHMFYKDSKEMGIRLIRFDGFKGIIKCSHLETKNTIILLKSIDKLGSKNVELVTISTSGTIRSLIKKHMSDIMVFTLDLKLILKL